MRLWRGVLCDDANFAQGWITSPYEGQKSRTRKSLLGERTFINQIIQGLEMFFLYLKYVSVFARCDARV